MDKQEVIERLCALCSVVGAHFEHHEAHDCFCGTNTLSASAFQFSPKVLDFIETAVSRAISANTSKT